MHAQALNTIADNAWTARQNGLPKFNPYRSGSLEHDAYERGWQTCGVSFN